MSQEVPERFTADLSITEKILYVLHILHKASADEVAMEIMELQGTSSEEGVAELTDEVAQALDKLCEEQSIRKIREHRQRVRYAI